MVAAVGGRARERWGWFSMERWRSPRDRTGDEHAEVEEDRQLERAVLAAAGVSEQVVGVRRTDMY